MKKRETEESGLRPVLQLLSNLRSEELVDVGLLSLSVLLRRTQGRKPIFAPEEQQSITGAIVVLENFLNQWYK